MNVTISVSIQWNYDTFGRKMKAVRASNQGVRQENACPFLLFESISVRGFDFIDRLKSLLEAECPGIVSCADIVALAARESTVVTDLVLLSSAHTIGISLCTSFSNRLYNFTGVGDQDPTLDSEYAANLKSRKCRTQNDNTKIVEMDRKSRTTFDLSYYSLLLKRRGLFESGSALTRDLNTLALINQLLQGSLQNFLSEFAMSMEKMGTSGEIRKKCAVLHNLLDSAHYH
ncbi:putative peroxidase [Helianthus debilis subsp. tardiflorus]